MHHDRQQHAFPAGHGGADDELVLAATVEIEMYQRLKPKYSNQLRPMITCGPGVARAQARPAE